MTSPDLFDRKKWYQLHSDYLIAYLDENKPDTIKEFEMLGNFIDSECARVAKEALGRVSYILALPPTQDITNFSTHAQEVSRAIQIVLAELAKIEGKEG